MPAFWIIVVTGFVFIGAGLSDFRAPLDLLWKQHERYLLARGQSPQRNEIWEKSTRRQGGIMIAVGSAILILAAWMLWAASQQPSGVSIDGHNLTKQEWDACGHDTMECVRRYPSPSQ